MPEEEEDSPEEPEETPEPEEEQEEETETPVCGNCGVELPGKVNHCPKCGDKLDRSQFK